MLPLHSPLPYCRTQDLGVPAERIFPISAATGQGVLDLVRAVRAVLDELGPQAVQYETNALNQTSVPARRDARVDDFTVSVEEVQGGAPSGGCLARDLWGCRAWEESLLDWSVPSGKVPLQFATECNSGVPYA